VCIRCYQDLIKQPSIFSDFLGFNAAIPFHPDHVSICVSTSYAEGAQKKLMATLAEAQQGPTHYGAVRTACPTGASKPRSSAVQTTRPLTIVATGPPRNVRPSKGELRLLETDRLTS